MNLFHQFAAQSPNRVFFAILLGALAGACYSLLIPVILTALADPTIGLATAENDIQRMLFIDVNHPKFAALFFLLCVVVLGARTVSQLILVSVSISFITSMRLQLYQRILRAPVPVIDRIGLPKITAVLTEDVRRVVWGARLLPDVLVNVVTVLGMLGFLFYLNGDALWFVVKVLVFGVVTYQLPVLLANRSFVASQNISDKLYAGIRGLVQGIKDLKLDARKRQRFLSELLHAREGELARTDKRAFTTMALANNYGDMLSFFAIGTVAFIFVNYHALSTTELVGVVMILLYLAAPVAGILAIAPQVAMGKVSLQRINELATSLVEESATPTIRPVDPWTALHFDRVIHRYDNDGQGFVVGPVSFSARRGEITFIVGGNGSGKSTLGKLMSLHYRASAGEIRFGDTPVNDDTLESVRQEVAAIYSDYYLFDRLLGEIGPQTQEQARAYLQSLGLEGKLTIDDGKFSTLALSDGQKRRIALLVAFMEDKNLYLFDEWAADQDPAFKEVFYRGILPELRARGKCVVVISHDDRYFDVADRVLVMESGQLVSERVAAVA